MTILAAELRPIDMMASPAILSANILIVDDTAANVDLL